MESNNRETVEIKAKLEEHEKRLIDIEKDKRLNEFQFKTIMETLAEMKIDLKELKETPSKRWDLAITGTISAIVAYIASIMLK